MELDTCISYSKISVTDACEFFFENLLDIYQVFGPNNDPSNGFTAFESMLINLVANNVSVNTLYKQSTHQLRLLTNS